MDWRTTRERHLSHRSALERRGGRWIGDVPDLTYCTAHGPTPHDAVAQVEAAIDAWPQAARPDGPAPPRTLIICQAAGLTTAAYSFGYVAGWSGGDPKKVKTTAERVVTCARTILDRTGVLTDDEREAA